MALAVACIGAIAGTPDGEARPSAKSKANVSRKPVVTRQTAQKSGPQRTATLGRRRPSSNPLPTLDPTLVSHFLQGKIKTLWDANRTNPAAQKMISEFLRGSKLPSYSHRDPDTMIMGDLVRHLPLPNIKARSTGRLKVSALEFETGPKHVVASPMKWVRKAMAGKTDVVIAPEWFFVPKGRFYTAVEFAKLRNELVAMSKGRDTLLVPGTIAWRDAKGNYRNTALAISNGVVLKQYDKRNDGEDHDFATRRGTTWKAGTESGTFMWRGLRVGLEICRDHGDASLRWDLLGKTRQNLVDVQIIVSAGVPIKHPAVGIGGVVLMAQGSRDLGPFGGVVGRRVPSERFPTIKETKAASTRDLGNGQGTLAVFDL